ncbi:MAG: hypothetical protein E7523_05550 [Ruminococcaceae bacterium]|nr:hypothetical protein [Oscillospiraceae bacterium]
MEKSNSNVVRRLMSVILVVLMIFSMIPSTVFAGEVADIVLPTEDTTAPTAPEVPSGTPSEVPSEEPTSELIEAPTDAPAEEPTSELIEAPTDAPAEEPTSDLVEAPTDAPAEEPTEEPTQVPEEEITEPKPEGQFRLFVEMENAAGNVTMNGKVSRYVDVAPGSLVDVSIEAPGGYYISSASIIAEDGSVVKAQSHKTDEKFTATVEVTADIKISVEFDKKEYKVKVESGENGVVKYNGEVVDDAVSVKYEDTPEFLIVAEKGYIVSAVRFNETSKNINTSSSFDETDEGLVFTADAVKADSTLVVEFKKAEIQDVKNVLENEYFTVTFAPDTEPVAILDVNGGKTIILPADGTATFEPAGEYADGYISLNGGAFKKSVGHTGKLSTVTVKKTDVKNPSRYKDIKVNCEILIDNKVEPAEILFPGEQTNAVTNPYYACENLNGVRISVPTDISELQEVVYTLTVGKAVVVDNILLGNEDATKDTLRYNSESRTFEGTIDIAANMVNQRDDVFVSVTVTDKAGNRKATERKLIVNTDEPQVTISIDGEIDENATLDDHYKAQSQKDVVRTATIEIRDWVSTFDAAAATECIRINAYKSSADTKNTLENTDGALYTVSGWKSKGNIHTYTIQFIGDAYYEWSFDEYVNKAGKSDSAVEATARDGSDNVFNFTCDTTAPTAVLTFGTGLENLWNKTVGYFFNTSVTVFAEDVDDNISKDATHVLYYVLEDAHVSKPLNRESLDELFEQDFFVAEAPSISDDAAVVVYARITDGAGNVLYLSTDGLIIDTTAGGLSATIEKPAKIIDGASFYNDDVTITITEVHDNPVYRGTKKDVAESLGVYSGIASVDYVIDVLDAGGNIRTDVVAEKGNLYTFEMPEKLEFSDLVLDLHPGDKGFNNEITVDAEKFNYDYVRVTITATDNAGNEIAKQEFKFHINPTPPTIQIVAKGTVANDHVIGDRAYFKKDREAKVIIEDRASSFNPTDDNFKLDIVAVDGSNVTKTTTDGEEPTALDSTYKISEWESEGDVHTAIVTFYGNANYIVNSVSYTNNANVTADVKKADGQSPLTFTVDTAKPSASVSIDETTWTKLVEKITFGIYKKTAYAVEIKANDLISPLAKVEYFKTDDPIDVADIKGWLPAYTYGREANQTPEYMYNETLTVNKDNEDERFVIYVRVTDIAGNEEVISSNGAILDPDEPTIELSYADPDPECNGVYTRDLTINVHVNDKFLKADGKESYYSGIKTIDYWIGFDKNKDDKIDDSEKILPSIAMAPVGQKNVNLFTFKNDNPTKEELRDEILTSFTVSAKEFNACNVFVGVVAVDNADNSHEEIRILDFDITAPVIKVSYDENDPRNEKYFNVKRTAEFVVTERTNHFKFEGGQMNIYLNPTEAKESLNGIIITATKLDGSAANATLELQDGEVHVADLGAGEANSVISVPNDAWSTKENDKDVNADTHALQVQFAADANYTVSINYKDKANHPTTELLGETEFTVDKTAPTGSIIVTTVSTKTTTKFESREETGDTVEGETVTSEPITFVKLATDLTYSIYANKSISFDQTSDDEISPIAEVFCYTQVRNDTDALEALTVDALEEVEWTALEKDGTKVGTIKTIDPDTQAVVYLKIIDMAGNVTYISTTGLIADSKAPVTETNAPELNIEIVDNDNPLNGIYNGDVVVKVTAQEPVEGKTYSGLKTIYYKVYKDDSVTQTGTLFDFTTENPSWDDLEQDYVYADPSTDEVQNVINEWESGGGNGFIVVKSSINDSNGVRVEVYAEDNALNTGKAELALKIDITPPEVSVSYSPETGDSENTSYFNSNRTATITVKERNFDTKNFTVSINNADGSSPSMSEWSEPTGSGDDTTYTATIEYTADGDYTFSVDTCVDDAGNEAKTDLSTLDASFTIDQTVPTVSVSYDNNSAQNEKYFNATRTATITVNEHNFEESRATSTITASLAGSSITTPSVSWSSNGDTHTGTVNYSSDGDYTFDIQVIDMAGNQDSGADYGSSVAAKEFTVDTTIDSIIVTGVENGKSYKGEVIPEVNFSDINHQSHSITIQRTRKDEKNLDVKDIYLADIYEDGNGFSGTFDTFDATKQENDGLYTFFIEAADLAGNTISQTVQFTLNRFGSVYTFSDYLVSLKGQYVQKVEENLIITEYNPDKLVKDSLVINVSRDGAPLDDVAYEVTPVINEFATVGESGWYQYDYIIDTSNFAVDGIYKITVSSQDAVGNRPETTNYDDCEIHFSVDTTAPEITSVVGLEKAIVNATEQEVDFEIFDAIGLKSVTLYVNDEIVQVFDNFEDFIRFVGSQVFGEGSNQKIRFVVEDLAGNITDTDAVDADGNYIFNPGFAFERDLTVSTNLFVRWYANKTVFWGSIAGTAALVAAIIILVAYIRRKKEEK